MLDRPPLPMAARIVAVVDIVLGAWALIDLLIALTQSHIKLNLVVVLLPAGIGLLMKSNAWRLVTRIAHGLVVLAVPTCLLFMFFQGGQWSTTGPGPLVALVVLFGVAVYAFFIWGYFVLGREDVRRACGWPPG